jgi:PAS domain-containing protein
VPEPASPHRPSVLARVAAPLARAWRRESALARLLEQADCGLLGVDARGQVEICSAVAAAMLGAEVQEVVGSPLARWLALPNAAERERMRGRTYTETSPMTLMSLETLDGI